ncbi:glycosyltransferase family 8 protein [Draconibacterium sp. IB214405]|uniref:glycosyltransferase family 8 protein n=1 Tax=Draconibacterium sp. IB214405 TaxID=3097352 RepID=UPI002A17053B|nr:glycosyltransferase family 8 protein [Draconibacterium sp. IB214405]MDX8339297.1 glycosyltransferase family 8 protein [Draconibacterium sp. IB214405]
MNIVLSTDNNFVQHCAATLVSLLENNKGLINIYILSEGLTDSNNRILEEIVLARGGNFKYIQVDSDLIQSLPMPYLKSTSHISLATYYRLVIPFLLPSSINKVIYLDCDIIIRKSIKELWEVDIETFAVAAVYQITQRTIKDAIRLGYDPSYGYFNAGVLLINLSYWRQHNITKKLLSYLTTNQNRIIFHDQDALNAVLHDKSFKISCKWNMLTIFFIKRTLIINDEFEGKIINDYLDYKKSFPKEALDPTIIHFVAKPKPWDPYCTHPFRIEYYNYLVQTPWYTFKEPKTFYSSVYRFLKRVKNKIINPDNSYFSS